MPKPNYIITICSPCSFMQGVHKGIYTTGTTSSSFLLKEDSFYILLEDNSKIVLE